MEAAESSMSVYRYEASKEDISLFPVTQEVLDEYNSIASSVKLTGSVDSILISNGIKKGYVKPEQSEEMLEESAIQVRSKIQGTQDDGVHSFEVNNEGVLNLPFLI